MNKRIVILRSNPVDPDSRVEKEAFALSKLGYSVTILCWDRSSNHSARVDKLHDSTIDIIRLGYKASYGEGFKNIIPYLRFQLAMRRWLKKYRNCYDLVHACDFDTANFTISVAKKFQKHFVFDVFDFICGDAKTLLQKIVKKRQFTIINKADATIICSEDRKNQIKGSHPKLLEIIHNSPPDYPLKSFESNESDKTKIVYVGILSNNRLLKEECEIIQKHKDWLFYVGGFGLHEQYFELLNNSCDNIFFLGKLPYEETLELESKADIMLAIYDPSIENHIYAAPNKFYEALMLGKPLIMIKGTGMSAEIETNDIGVLIDYSSIGFEKGVESLIKRKDEWPKMSKKMKELYKNKYSWSTMIDRLASLYNFVFDKDKQ